MRAQLFVKVIFDHCLRWRLTVIGRRSASSRLWMAGRNALVRLASGRAWKVVLTVLTLLFLWAIVGSAFCGNAGAESLQTDSIFIINLPTRIGIFEFDENTHPKILFEQIVKEVFVNSRSGDNRTELYLGKVWRNDNGIPLLKFRRILSNITTALVVFISDLDVCVKQYVISNAFTYVSKLPSPNDLASFVAIYRPLRIYYPENGPIIGLQYQKLSLQGACCALRFLPSIPSKYSQSQSENGSEIVWKVFGIGYRVGDPGPEPSHLPILFLPLAGILMIVGFGIIATAQRGIIRCAGIMLSSAAVIAVALPYILMSH
jgi:hypothetical protein